VIETVLYIDLEWFERMKTPLCLISLVPTISSALRLMPGYMIKLAFLANQSFWCLIHNAHLRKIPRFCKIKDLKIIHLERIFD
jgi:hypothetical protein